MMQHAEFDRFTAICRRHGLSADQFALSGDDAVARCDGRAAVISEVVVTHHPSTIRRWYLRDHFFDWLDAFERDALAGCFRDVAQDW
jgi:hypothetical protein